MTSENAEGKAADVGGRKNAMITESLEHIGNGNRNKLFPEDSPAHDWYRFVLSFPPQLVRHYLAEFGMGGQDVVLDPFCGTGTCLVEAKKHGVRAIGVEAHPMAAFASRVKTDWKPSPDGMIEHTKRVARSARISLSKRSAPLRTLPPETHKLLLKNSISPLPLHKVLVLLSFIRRDKANPYLNHQLLALAKALISEIGNLHFGPEVGVRNISEDAAAIETWLDNVISMAADLKQLRKGHDAETNVFCEDSRQFLNTLAPASISAVITSPPYPNEKDYTRTTRLETVLLGFIKDRSDLRAMKQHLLRSNTRNVYKADSDDEWVESFPGIQQIADKIEKRRVELGKTSGFERLYGRVTKLYFGGMARHLADLRIALKPGAKLAYVVGDQASYLRIMIRTGQILGEIAKSLGYRVEKIDLFRTRFSTATGEHLREEVLVLEWPG